MFGSKANDGVTGVGIQQLRGLLAVDAPDEQCPGRRGPARVVEALLFHELMGLGPAASLQPHTGGVGGRAVSSSTRLQSCLRVVVAGLRQVWETAPGRAVPVQELH